MSSISPNEDPAAAADESSLAHARTKALQLHATMQDMETQYVQVGNEKDELEQQVGTLQKELQALQQAVPNAQEQEILEKKVKVAEEKLQATEEQVQTKQERLDRMQVEADQLRQEISRLSKSNTELSENLANVQIQQTVKESQAIPLALEKQRLVKELDSLQAHANWLHAELDAKTKDYQHLQQESRDKSLQLQLQLDRTTSEKDAAQVRLEALEQVEEELQNKVQQVSQDLLQSKQEMATLQETGQEVVLAEQKLNKVQEQHLLRWEQRYNSVVSENEALKAAAGKAMQTHEKELDDVEQQWQLKYDALVQQQKKEQASSALPALPAIPALTGAQDKPSDDDEPLNMTDLYTRLEQTKLAFQQERIQREHWQLQFQKVQADIANRRPQMLRQAQEHDIAVRQVQDYQDRLQIALDERDDAHQEARDLRKEMESNKRRLKTREMETKELAKQVQALLARRSGIPMEDDDFNQIPTTIQEVQNQNQRLLVEQRHLEEQVEELTKKLDADELRDKLNASESSVATLRQQREEQEKIVDQIVLQRDLYKSLLATKDQNLLAAADEESSALDMLRKHSDRTKELEKKIKELEGELAKARSENDHLVRDKEAVVERLSRHETHLAELNNSMNDLQRDVMTAKGETARAKADAEYHQDRCGRLESSLERSNGERVQLTNAKNELQKINTELQHSLSNNSMALSRVEGEKRQLGGNMRLIKIQLETLRASETRTMEENSQLRAELTQQGALMDSVRRIESGLQAKSESEKESLKEELERVNAAAKTEKEKYVAEMENLNARIGEYDSRVQDLSSSKDKAQADSLESKKALLEVKTELQAATSKCSILESQLRAAKKKLGEADDLEGPEVSLQARIDDLTSKLDSARAEIDSFKERAENYQKVATDSEKALADIQAALDAATAETEKEAANNREQLELLRAENTSKQEVIEEMTNDLAGERGEREKLKTELEGKIAALETHIKNNEEDVEAAKASSLAMKLDVESLKNDATLAQNNYERELAMHSKARSELREACETRDEALHAKNAAEEKANDVKKERDEKATLWEQEKTSLKETQEFLEKRLEEIREQNKVLHEQIENLAKKSEAEYAGVATGENAESQKAVTELRQVVQFLRSENDMIQTQLDTAKRSLERERASANVFKRSLDEARAELKVLHSEKEETSGKNTVADLTTKLKTFEEQVKVLSDSNKLLREEADRWQTQVASLTTELNRAKTAAKPAETVEKELGVQIAALNAEKDSLERELESWKGRVKSLVSKFNQIDPAEHQQLQARVEQMTKEKDSLNAWKKATEEENTRIRGIAKNLNQKNREQKSLIDKQQAQLSSLTYEQEKLRSASAAGSEAAKERDELKAAVEKMKKDAGSIKTELEGANQHNAKLRERLRQFQTTIRELKAANVAAQSKTTQSAPPQNQSKPSDSAAVDKPKQEDSKAASFGEPLVSVPPGGFKFGPSKKATKARASQTATAPPAMKESKSLRATAPAFTPSASGGAPAPPPKKQTAKDDSAPESLKRKSPPTAESPKAGGTESKASRRLSGEAKEMSLKEKLLERRRAAQRQLEEAAAASERAAKKARTEGAKDVADDTKTKEGDKGEGEMAEVPTSDKGEGEKTEVSKGEKGEGEKTEVPTGDKQEGEKAEVPPVDSKPPETSSSDSGKVAEKAADEQKEEEQAWEDTPSQPEDSEKTKIGHEAPVGEATATDPSSAAESDPSVTTGTKAPALFGSSAEASNPNPFGTASSSTKATTFGGTGSPFGSGGTGSLTFGAPTSLSGSSSFLNMKPPGSSGVAPTFSFGSTSSITLPTPALPNAPAPSPFGAFSQAGSTPSFGSAFGSSSGGNPVTSKPLFEGFGKTASADTTEETKAVDADSGDTENVDDAEGDNGDAEE